MPNLGAFPAAGAADEGDALVLLGVEHLLERRLANAVDVRRQLLHPALPEHSLDLLGVDVQLATGVDRQQAGTRPGVGQTRDSSATSIVTGRKLCKAW